MSHQLYMTQNKYDDNVRVKSTINLNTKILNKLYQDYFNYRPFLVFAFFAIFHKTKFVSE